MSLMYSQSNLLSQDCCSSPVPAVSGPCWPWDIAASCSRGGHNQTKHSLSSQVIRTTTIKRKTLPLFSDNEVFPLLSGNAQPNNKKNWTLPILSDKKVLPLLSGNAHPHFIKKTEQSLYFQITKHSLSSQAMRNLTIKKLNTLYTLRYQSTPSPLSDNGDLSLLLGYGSIPFPFRK